MKSKQTKVRKEQVEKMGEDACFTGESVTCAAVQFPIPKMLWTYIMIDETSCDHYHCVLISLMV